MCIVSCNLRYEIYDERLPSFMLLFCVVSSLLFRTGTVPYIVAIDGLFLKDEWHGCLNVYEYIIIFPLPPPR